MTTLPILEEEDPSGYRLLDHLPVDQQQKVLLDALWRANTRKQKLDACYALQYYFSKIMEPPRGKDFSYYALINGPNIGVYCYYSSLVQAKQGLQTPIYKGFYSFLDALTYLWDNVYNKNVFIYIEEEPRSRPLVENYQTELSDLREQINHLITEITELKKSSTEEGEILMTPTPHQEQMDTEAFVDSLFDEAEGRNPRNHRLNETYMKDD